VAGESYPGTDQYPGVDFYDMEAGCYEQQLHPQLGPTKLYGYRSVGGQYRHLGGSIIAKRGTAVRLRMTPDTSLPAGHILPVDRTMLDDWLAPGMSLPDDRIAVHLHGGKVPWTSDGGPWSWFTRLMHNPAGPPAWLPTRNNLNDKTYDYWYPNLESARMMWFHDHAIGNTRLNAYAGMAAGYIVTDDTHESAVNNYVGAPERRVPLVFQDKIFKEASGYDYLWYPDVYDTQFFTLTPGMKALPYPSVNTEFWGDTMLANGVAYPTFTVEPKRYRFQILNACNTRFLSLRLLYSFGPNFPDNGEVNENDPGPALQVVGTEGGFLDPEMNPQGVLFPNDKSSRPLLLAPAERAEVIIDFSRVGQGKFLILNNDAPVPFPGGTPLADFDPRNPKLATPPRPGYAPNTRTLVRFYVASGSQAPASVVQLPPLDPAPLWNYRTMTPTVDPSTITYRDLTLNEAVDEYGRLMPLLGSNKLNADPLLGFGLKYHDNTTERAASGAVEIWRIFNLTADTHPIHFHLSNVQIISRQKFNARQYNGFAPNFTGVPVPPDPEEMGWKETVRMNPGECTTVIMRLDLPPDPVIPIRRRPMRITVPSSPRTGGAEYVWHCHILEHEEHDMMRPLVVDY
jgi:spore coat protein A